MKKVLISLLTAVLFVTGALVLTACEDKEDVVKVDMIEASVVKNTVYKVGEAFDTSTIETTAILSDGSKTKITSSNSLIYDKQELKLDNNNKFTEAGTFTLTVKFLRHTATVELTVIEP